VEWEAVTTTDVQMIGTVVVFEHNEDATIRRHTFVQPKLRDIAMLVAFNFPLTRAVCRSLLDRVDHDHSFPIKAVSPGTPPVHISGDCYLIDV
jgi:hypothetical protein